MFMILNELRFVKGLSRLTIYCDFLSVRYLRFLRGICAVQSCPFSHTVSQEKVPLCSFYAAGCCNREACPYLHVFHGKNAKYCQDFARGYCKLGNKVMFTIK